MSNAVMRNELKIFIVEVIFMGKSSIEFFWRPHVCRKKKLYSGPMPLITLIFGEPHLGETHDSSLG